MGEDMESLFYQRTCLQEENKRLAEENQELKEENLGLKKQLEEAAEYDEAARAFELDSEFT
ncbi:hypothetical protein [Halobacillus salinus]|uniref:hypothetical protein n=1 Tax=Halobacillus salinus TaxID=192814 RepID=UPI0009A7575F|nr:hypothetical protein [Halobacillus salinus]